jgi:hypothetical protein
MLSSYDALLENSKLMLQTAKEQRWDDLIVLDQQRKACLLNLIAGGPATDIQQMQAMMEILDLDKQTRQLVESQQQELMGLIASVDNERKLANAYGHS